MKFLAFILLFFIVACEQEIDLDIDFGKEKAVLNCVLDPDTEIQVSLTKSANLNDTGNFQIIEQAQVLVYENNKFLDSLILNSKGYYCSSLKPKAGFIYTIKAILPDSTFVIASDSIPQYTMVDSFICSENIQGRLRLKLYFKDIVLEKNYYKLELFELLDNNKEFKTVFRIDDENFRAFSLLDTSILFRDLEFKSTSVKFKIMCDAPKAKRMHLKISQLSEPFFKYTTFANQNYLANTGSEYARVPNFSNVSNNIGILGSRTVIDVYSNVK